MADLKEAIKQIAGTEPTPEQIHRIQAIAHALDIPQGDAMFPILVTLDVYHGLFTRLPQQAATEAQALAKTAAEKTIRETANQALSDISSAVAQTAQKVASNVAAREKRKWTAIAVSFSFLAIIGTGLLAFHQGYTAGEDHGAIHVAWAVSPTGKALHALSPLAQQEALQLGENGLTEASAIQKNGQLSQAAAMVTAPDWSALVRLYTYAPVRDLAACNRPGWKTGISGKWTMCWPWQDGKRGQYGWPIGKATLWQKIQNGL